MTPGEVKFLIKKNNILNDVDIPCFLNILIVCNHKSKVNKDWLPDFGALFSTTPTTTTTVLWPSKITPQKQNYLNNYDN